MTDLQRYRKDIIDRNVACETFCANLIEENFPSTKAARKWLDKTFIPAFEMILEEWEAERRELGDFEEDEGEYV